MWKCTSDSWSFIHTDVPAGPLEGKASRRHPDQIRKTDSICSLRHQPVRKRRLHFRFPAECLSSSFKEAEPSLSLEEPHFGLSDLILSFTAQTGPLRAGEEVVMGIWHMTSTWQNVTRPSDCVLTSSRRFLSFLLITPVHLSVALSLNRRRTLCRMSSCTSLLPYEPLSCVLCVPPYFPTSYPVYYDSEQIVSLMC